MKRDATRDMNTVSGKIFRRRIFIRWISCDRKMEYIHQNPVAKDWRLVEDRAEYIYSSAGYYDCGRKPIIEITDINERLTFNPSPRTAKGA
jgi:hypothetical protein